MKALSQAADLRLPLRLAFSVVLARAKLSAILRSKARFLAAVRSRTRLASSLKPTSSTQWSPFSIAQWLRMAVASCAGVPRATVHRDTRLQVGHCKEVEDGRGGWGGRGPGGARPPRWRSRAHARAPAPDVGTSQAGGGAPPAAGRGPGTAVARAGRDRGRAERLARGVPGRGRGLVEEPTCRRV